ncbi:MAG: hypothetical protein AMXMBFR47_18160 [Planctomycetota bacterium]
MNAIVAVVVLLFQVAPQDGGEPQERGPRRGRFADLQQKIQKLVDSTRAFGDWDRHADLSREAVSKFFERAGWDSDEDTFAQEMFRAVDAQPPWEPQRRAEVFFGLLSDRYQLDDDQRARLQEITVRTAVRIFAAQGDRLLEYVPEMIQARAAGEPFTAEQIARWSEMAEPVIAYASERVQEAAEEFMDDLRPEQRELVARDVQAGMRRVETVKEFMVDWKAGRWEPSDWGLEDDPIQIGKDALARENGLAQAQPGNNAGAAGGTIAVPAGQAPEHAPPADRPTERPAPPERRRPEPGNPGEGQPEVGQTGGGQPEAGQPSPPPEAPSNPPQPPRKTTVAVADDPWSKYVTAFIAKYSLDERQAQQAALIGEESRKRAEEISTRAAGTAGDAPAKAAPLNEKSAAELDKIFAKMKMRLERLPTRAQRKAASAIELPDLDFRGGGAKPGRGGRAAPRPEPRPQPKPEDKPAPKP